MRAANLHLSKIQFHNLNTIIMIKTKTKRQITNVNQLHNIKKKKWFL